MYIHTDAEHVLACAIVSNFQASNNQRIRKSTQMDVLPCARHMDRTELKLVSMYLTVIEKQQLKYIFLHHTSYIKVGLQNTMVAYVSSL